MHNSFVTSIKFSVVLPTFNRIDRLKACLPTFLETRLEGVEFIIVDNNSTDGTYPYLLALARDDSRLVVVKNSQNLGPIKTLLIGYCAVRSPFAMFLADDDCLSGDYISDCYSLFQKYPNVNFIHDRFVRKSDMNVPLQYSVLSSGTDALRAVYKGSGRYPGICFRMSKLNLAEFPLNDGCIYPQVSLAIQFALSGDIALIYSSGVYNPFSWGSSSFDAVQNQNRPIDLGINERLLYLKDLDPLTRVELSDSLSRFCYRLFSSIYSTNPQYALQFLYSLVPTLLTRSPKLLLFLVQGHHLSIAVSLIIRICLKPIFLYNYFLWLIMLLRKSNCAT